ALSAATASVPAAKPYSRNLGIDRIVVSSWGSFPTRERCRDHRAGRPGVTTIRFRSPERPASGKAGVRNLRDELELRPLGLLGDRIAAVLRGEAALRGERELLPREVARGLLQPALDLLGRLDLGHLRRDEPEDD